MATIEDPVRSLRATIASLIWVMVAMIGSCNDKKKSFEVGWDAEIKECRALLIPRKAGCVR